MLEALTFVAALFSAGSASTLPTPAHADWTISALPVLEIHGTWGSIAGVTRLPSGQVFVADRMSREISVHSAAGSLLTTVGGPGSGPGEFRTLNRPLLCGGDSVYFWDSGLGRISIFDADGSYQRSFNDLEVRALDGRFQGVTDVNCSPTGVFVTTSFNMDRPPRQEGIHRLEVGMYLAREGGDMISLGPFPGDDMYWIDSQMTRAVFGRRTLFAVAGDRLFAGVTDRLQVEVFSMSGDRIGSIADNVAPTPVSRGVLEAFLATQPERHRAALAAREYPERLPAFSGLLVDPDGNLWVQEYAVPGDSVARWRVFGPDGRRLAALEMPAGFTVTQVGADFVLGISRDAWDVESVRMYRLTRG